MKQVNLQRAKGVRDFDPAQKILRQNIIDILQKNFELFGFNPIETPILERYDLFASKFGQGDQSDAMAETFKLKDQGKRDLVLRNEFTVPLARYVGMNPNLKMPFKRYQIGQVFRDGPIKLGRYREFWQCDVDIVGVKDMTAEAELLNLAKSVFGQLKMSVEIQVNNRKFLNEILDYFKVSEKDKNSVIIILDKLEKIGEDGVQNELKENKIYIENLKKMLDLLSISGSNNEKIKAFEKVLTNSEGLQEIKALLSLTKNNKQIIFVPTLARGMSYYTGTVFEVFLTDKKKLASAVGGGGRYDDMIGGFLNRKEQMPAIGISFGLETILDALNNSEIDSPQTLTQVYVVGLGVGAQDILPIVEQLRQAGINTDYDLQSRNLKKNLNYVDAQSIKYAIIVGEDELKKNKVTLKDMKTGKQEIVSLKKTIEKILK